MKIDILTINKAKELVKQEVLLVNEEVWKECNKLREEILLLQDEIKILKRNGK